MLGLPWPLAHVPLPFPGFNLYYFFSVISMTVILLTSGNPSSELLKLRVVSGALELYGISGAVTTDVYQPLALTATTVGITQVHFLLSWALEDTPEHDVAQHGAQEQGEAAGHPLDTGEVARN